MILIYKLNGSDQELTREVQTAVDAYKWAAANNAVVVDIR
jgi:hypothetical protein